MKGRDTEGLIISAVAASTASDTSDFANGNSGGSLVGGGVGGSVSVRDIGESRVLSESLMAPFWVSAARLSPP